MKQFLMPPWFRAATATAAVCATGLLLACWHFGIWSCRDFEIYCEMKKECHPVWQELHSGRIYRGQPVTEVIRQTQPTRVTPFEDCTILEYQKGRGGLCFTGITVIARDGSLISAEARSCTWQRTFFDEMSALEQQRFWERFWSSRQPKLPAAASAEP